MYMEKKRSDQLVGDGGIYTGVPYCEFIMLHSLRVQKQHDSQQQKPPGDFWDPYRRKNLTMKTNWAYVINYYVKGHFIIVHTIMGMMGETSDRNQILVHELLVFETSYWSVTGHIQFSKAIYLYPTTLFILGLLLIWSPKETFWNNLHKCNYFEALKHVYAQGVNTEKPNLRSLGHFILGTTEQIMCLNMIGTYNKTLIGTRGEMGLLISFNFPNLPSLGHFISGITEQIEV
ncbi:hypothetical protein ACJX0J_008925, partial [Zea mays]